ncbi:MAG: class I SAM-dependent methyltransferase, partial [Planctomycetota bacterium]
MLSLTETSERKKIIRPSGLSSLQEYVDLARHQYRINRIRHWDRVSKQKERPRQASRFYHRLLRHYYSFQTAQGLQVLEIGCGHGDLLAALKPSLGVGLDFSSNMIRRAAAKYPQLNFMVADAHDFIFRHKF